MLRSGAIPSLILMILTTAGCVNASPQGVAGARWRWEGQTGPEKGEWLEVDHPGHYTLEFAADGRYAMRADCNTGNGGYTVDGDEIEFGLGALTQAQCPPHSLDGRFLAALAEVKSFSRDGDALVLHFGGKDGDAGEMRFAAAREVALEDTTWLVRACNNGKGGVESVRVGAGLDATFAEDGRVTGSAGCNRYFASFTRDGEKLTIGPVGSSRKACASPEGVMQQEAAFLAALGSVATWRFENGRLDLRTTDGARALGLVAAVVGSVRLPEGETLPGDATLSVQLRDVSLADAPSLLIGEQLQMHPEAPDPLRYEVSYDPADIDERHTYAVSARVHADDGKLLFVSTRSNPVLTGGHARLGVDVELEAVR